ncbi:MAG TPA: isoprenylcysteine carboxylmethyltransferase family protein [Pyrinomonadaceae bacterium]|jgi:protein-S-isoprenylcysteine O-methyltransferase Ste14|nr:isoprenylcysteine carboxylmethyltransferase family protein [Pyrinomonadaceae bacterium]
MTTSEPSGVSFWKLIITFLYLTSFPVILFLLAGDWRWTEGWLFSALFILMCYAPLLYLYFYDPALLKERFGSPIQQGQKRWDKVLLSVFFIDFLVWFAIMPLDAKRFGWSPAFPFWVRTTGTVLLIVSGVILFEALKENTFAAPVVKIQKERGQHVISTGLYGIVRHPMYAGAVLLFISSPLLLGSVFGLILGLVLIITIAVRSIGEEAMLKQELEGYSNYMKKVKWRMIPFIF